MYLFVMFLNVVYFYDYAFSASKCTVLTTCRGCIGYAFERCVWCPSKYHAGRRCQQKTYYEENISWCNDTVYDPQLEFNVTQNDNFNAGRNGKNVVQFKPQQIKIKVRPGVPVHISMSYKPAKDYPLDVYYLMDTSYTMRTHVKTLTQQGLNIYEQLTNLTNNVRLGIGSFIEKPAMPFSDDPINTYSFKNDLSLSDDMTLFTKVIETIKIGGNYDNPEAGLDALMQAIVCKKEIGWREKARRIIVISTDETYHSAGDGKLVGTYRPNDMKCHLSVDGIYNETLKYDYPSVSQINKVVIDNNVKIIFNIAKAETLPHYTILEKTIQGAKVVKLDDKSDVVEMIKTEYKELISSVQLDYNLTSFSALKLEPDCSKNDNCIIKHDEALNVNATLTINTCPGEKKYRWYIGPMALGEKLEVDIEVDCECDCERPGRGEANSIMCTASGTYQCGVCKCNEERYGDTCQCTRTSTDVKDSEKCHKSNNDTVACSGRGTCKCGLCLCQEGYSGDFCQYNDNNCPRPGARICSGNGDCKSEKCMCYQDWVGDSCACPDHERSCIAPYSKEVCSGRGECKCGTCYCENRNNTSDCSGKFCDDCDEQIEKRCKELENYAYCNYKFNKTFCDSKTNITDTEIELLNRTQISSSASGKWCEKVLDDDAVLVFRYSGATKLIIQRDLRYPPKANIWVAVGNSIGGILFIGLITVVIWKYLIDMHDAREYQKFASDSAAAGFTISSNPLYQPPATDFTNVAYNNRECN